MGWHGHLVFDDNDFAWITNNLMQGTTINANCFGVLKPDSSPAGGRNGTPNSPIFGGGVLGQGFGITRDHSGTIGLLLNPAGDGMVLFVGIAAPLKPGIGLPKAP